MEKSGIDEPGNKKPGFFRISTPVAHPRIVYPNNSCDNPDSKEKKTNCVSLVNDFIKHV